MDKLWRKAKDLKILAGDWSSPYEGMKGVCCSSKKLKCIKRQCETSKTKDFLKPQEGRALKVKYKFWEYKKLNDDKSHENSTKLRWFPIFFIKLS